MLLLGVGVDRKEFTSYYSLLLAVVIQPCLYGKTEAKAFLFTPRVTLYSCDSSYVFFFMILLYSYVNSLTL